MKKFASYLFVMLFGMMSMVTSSNATDGLAGSEWGPVENENQFVRFEADNKVAGHGGCNRFFGSYEITPDGRLTFGRLAATKRGCPEPQMSNETRLFAMLEKVSSFKRQTGKLMLFDDAGGLLLELRHKDWD